MSRAFENSCIWTILAAVLLAVVTAPVMAAPPNDDDPAANDPVDQALKKAIAYLYSQQKGDNWEVAPRRNAEEAHGVAGAQWGGLTSIVTYTLLASGEGPQDPRLARSIAFLQNADIIGTYAMGMKLNIWNYIKQPTKEQKDVIKRDATLMMNGIGTEGDKLGLYRYYLDPTKNGDFDTSASNYGMLGMWAAAQQNLEIPPAWWQLVDKAWRGIQHKDGAWSYLKAPTEGHGPTVALTAAGVATLFIIQDYVNLGKIGECKGNIVDPDIERGMKWLSQNYKKIFGEGHKMYGLYNVERVGTASGYKYFDKVDWFEDGAKHLLQTQADNGSWNGTGGPVVATCYGILFLSKGRAPVMMNKLEYEFDAKGDKDKVANWNQRPRDIANLSRHTGKQLEKELNWQIVNLKVDIDDLHDAPVLYISGNQALTFSKEEKTKLKQYVESGGLILGHADCNTQAFTASFLRLGQELFPLYEFRELPPDHIVFHCHYSRTKWGQTLNVRGLSNGARELMLLIPGGDPGRFWQVQNFSSPQTKPMAELAANIYLYALDKTTLKSKFKGQTYIVKRTKQGGAPVKTARLEYAGNWDPEPGGWRRFTNLMANTRGLDLQVENVKLGEGKLNNAHQIAHLTGTVKFKFSDKQRAELKNFVNGGGTLIIDAAGGQTDFQGAVETELNAMFGDDAKRGLGTALAPEHPLFAAGNDKIAKFGYRNFARKMLVNNLATPRLRGINVNGRLGVFYSPEDLSVGMVGQSVEGIYGYDPATATKIMDKIVMFSAKPAPAVAEEKKDPPAKPKDAPKKPEGEKKTDGGAKPPANANAGKAPAK